jgi:hypothetical protein
MPMTDGSVEVRDTKQYLSKVNRNKGEIAFRKTQAFSSV